MKIHLIGIAGAGMHSLALYLSDAGHDVSGSDPWASEEKINFWNARGCRVYTTQCAENIKDAELVIYSAAVPASNPERMAAESLGIACSRGEALARFANKAKGSIAVCGTHGKGTTAGAILKGFNDAGIVVSDVLGAIPIGFEQPSIYRQNSEFLICEVDESDKTNLFHRPAYLLINNVEEDHLNVYRDLDDIVSTFADHVRTCAAQGTCVIIHYAGIGAPALYAQLENCPNVHWICEEGVLPVPALAWQISEPDEKGRCLLTIREANGDVYFILPHLGGRANAQNLASAACVLSFAGLNAQQISSSLASYKGLKDRCQIQRNGELMLVTDYASHPTCVKNDIHWLRSIAHRIIAVYHPYRYSLMKCHWNGLAQNLSDADIVLLAPMDGAGEPPVEDICSENLAMRIHQNAPACDARAFDSFETLENEARNLMQPGDCLLIFGGGPLFNLGKHIVFPQN